MSEVKPLGDQPSVRPTNKAASATIGSMVGGLLVSGLCNFTAYCPDDAMRISVVTLLTAVFAFFVRDRV